MSRWSEKGRLEIRDTPNDLQTLHDPDRKQQCSKRDGSVCVCVCGRDARRRKSVK